MENQNQRSEILKETVKGPIIVDRVFKGNFDKPGIMTAQLRQEHVTTSHYPTAKIGNSMTDSLFGADEFDIKAKDYISKDTRVTWIQVPEGTTVEDVVKRLSENPTAVIYRTLSNRPILTDNQSQGISQGLKTLDDFAEAQVVRYSETDEREELRGQIVHDPAGKIQYKVNHLSLVGKADEDYRTADKTDFYASPALELELFGAAQVANQSL